MGKRIIWEEQKQESQTIKSQKIGKGFGHIQNVGETNFAAKIPIQAEVV
jgi:hypothetical protein